MAEEWKIPPWEITGEKLLPGRRDRWFYRGAFYRSQKIKALKAARE
jgi:hypothetical protein